VARMETMIDSYSRNINYNAHILTDRCNLGGAAIACRKRDFLSGGL
jgi:molybdenum cofactor biosynthesis enzyme MoaA